MTKPKQISMHRGCGRPVIKVGLYKTCYSLRRQGAEYFGGNRETALKRDG